MKTILKEGIAVNCKTKEEAKEFLAMLDKDGYSWGSSSLNSHTNWEVHKENTCYCYKFLGFGEMGFADIDCYKDDCKVISFTEFKNSLKVESKMRYKVGDKVRVKSAEEIRKYPKSFWGNYIVISTIYFNIEMFETCGKVLTIKKVYRSFYEVEENRWRFDDEVLEDINTTISEHLIKGNKTIIKLSNGKVGTANCLPTDKFNEGYGAILAVARAYNIDLNEVVKLLEKKEPTVEYFTDENGRKYHVVKQDKYEVGDKVKAKDKCYILGKVIYDEPELHFAKNIVGEWAKNERIPSKMKILYVDNKHILIEYPNGSSGCLSNYWEDNFVYFGKVWEVVEC